MMGDDFLRVVEEYSEEEHSDEEDSYHKTNTGAGANSGLLRKQSIKKLNDIKD
jgi:hypothetical protein